MTSNQQPGDLNLPTPLTKEQIKVYLVGEALKGAYSNATFERNQLATHPDKLASSIMQTVNRMMRGF